MTKSLWGDEIIIDSPSTQKIIEKIDAPKKVSSKKIPLATRLNSIAEEVRRVLGKYIDDTIVITDETELNRYISRANDNGVIAIDTETNNSLDPLTCKLMGLCLYTPNEKNAYIPVNHVDVVTKTRLHNQLDESQVYDALSKLEADTKVIAHNGKFDYKVLKCTTGYEMPIYWDTLIGAKVLDENERAGLKEQYRLHIDSTQEKYDIEHLFDKLEYAIVDPSIFALYAATDPYMTYKLYLYQKEQFELKENSKLYTLFREVEMPVLLVATEMELTGISIDENYATALSNQYKEELRSIQRDIDSELDSYKELIAEWRKTEEAQAHELVNGKRSKSKSEQLQDPISLSSPTQLAILLYDILKVGVIDKKQPRGTGEDVLEQIDLPICKLVLKQRGIDKLINTYTDKLPECVNNKDNRIHAEFNQYGADTGRFSSSNPNLQNIPSHRKEVRMMFAASPVEHSIECDECDSFEIAKGDEVLIENCIWKNISDVRVGDMLQDEFTLTKLIVSEIIECESIYKVSVVSNELV